MMTVNLVPQLFIVISWFSVSRELQKGEEAKKRLKRNKKWKEKHELGRSCKLRSEL